MSLVYIPAQLAESRMYREKKKREWRIHDETSEPSETKTETRKKEGVK